MEDHTRHKLEGVLKARADDLRHGRRPRTRRPVGDRPLESGRTRTEARPAPVPARRCEECGAEIAPHRIRAMSGTTRCLDCQRAAEQPARPS